MIFLAPDWRQGATTWADEDCTMSAPSLEPCGTGAVHRIYQPHPAAKAPIISNHIESQDRTRTRPRDIWSMRSKHMPRLCYLMLYIYMQGIYIYIIYISDITFGETSSRRRGSFWFPASSPQAICHTSAVRHQVLRGTRQKPGETTQSERNECIDFRLPSGELTQQWKMAVYSGFSH